MAIMPVQAFTSTLELVGVKPFRGKKEEQGLTRLPKRGVPFSAVDHLSQTLGIEPPVLLDIIGLPARTAARRRREKFLKTEEADRLLRVARVLEEAVQVFGSTEKASRWLATAHPLFDRQTPLSMLSSDAGARAISDELGRIDYGEFA